MERVTSRVLYACRKHVVKSLIEAYLRIDYGFLPIKKKKENNSLPIHYFVVSKVPLGPSLSYYFSYLLSSRHRKSETSRYEKYDIFNLPRAWFFGRKLNTVSELEGYITDAHNLNRRWDLCVHFFKLVRVHISVD